MFTVAFVTFLIHTSGSFLTDKQAQPRPLQVDSGTFAAASPEMFETSNNTLGVLTPEWLAQGGVLLFLLGLIYIGFALYTLAKYFVLPCIDALTDKTEATPSVVGTLIVGGVTSAIGFVTTIIGSFVDLRDISLGNTVGPHIYDHTVVVALSLLCVSSSLLKPVGAKELLRDTFFVILVNILIILFFMDSFLVWYESAVLSATFLVYLLLLRILRLLMNKETVQTQPAGEPIEMDLAGQDSPGTEKYKVINLTPEPESSCMGRTFHYLTLPIKALMWATIPSPAWTCCKKLAWTTIFPATLLVSLLWQGILAYLMVQCGQVVGNTIGIPPEIMGLVILAPISLDIMVCGLLAGRGDLTLAVHSILGRSIIHLTLTLGLSSLIYNVVFMIDIEVDASCWPYPIIMLVLSLTILLLVVACTRGKPSRWWFIPLIILFLLHMAAALALQYDWIQCPV